MSRRYKDMSENKYVVLNIREQRLKENRKCKCSDSVDKECGCNEKKKENTATKARNWLFNNLKR